MPVSPAGQDRARRLDQALDEDRRRVGVDRNSNAADQQLESALSDEDSLAAPNTNQRRVAR